VWFRALDFGGGHRLARANDAELFVKFGTDGVLSTFAESRKRETVWNAVLATQNRERAAVFVVRVCATHITVHGFVRIEQRLVNLRLVELSLASPLPARVAAEREEGESAAVRDSS
jgi:hypothetical protein